MRILFAGSGEFGLPSLAALVSAGHEFPAVFTQPDRPAGRGRKLTPTAIGQFALEHSLPLIRTDDFNAEPLPPADLLVVIAFGQKISESAVSHCPLGSINLHSSRLPKFRGAAPIHWAILRGEITTGNSVIRLAQKMDAGAILAQSSIPIGEVETARELHDRLAEDGALLLPSVVADLHQGRAREMPQDESLATAAPKLNRDATRIDWTAPAVEISRRIRGLYPWPGCRVRLTDAAGEERDVITLVRARPAATGAATSPGRIASDGVRIGAGNSESVELLEVQPRGGRPMPLADYRRGHVWEPGMRLESILKGD